jgi:hypothetical protein
MKNENQKAAYRDESESNSYRSQSNMDMQSLIDMCSKKLEQEPTHKKALLLRASSYIKKNELDKVR